MPNPLTPITLDEQIQCVEREIKMRKKISRWGADAHMKLSKIDFELAAMSAVLETLRREIKGS